MTSLNDDQRSETLSDGERLALLERVLSDASLLRGALDLLADAVARALDVPVTLVSLVGRERQYFIAQIGLPEESASGTPISHSFCQHVVIGGEALVVENAPEHPLVCDNPAIQDLGVVAYAGQPIVVDGLTLGSFCAIDNQPRAWTERELSALRRFADLVEFLIEGRLTMLGQVLESVESAEARGHEQDARLTVYETIANERDRVQSLNRRLQHALLPIPVAPTGLHTEIFHRAGSDRLLLGGDFVTTEQAPDGGLDFIVCDVTGHGPEATALAISLRAAWRALQAVDTDLGELIGVLDRLTTEAKLYATVLLGHLSPDGTLVALSAGHAPPILADPDGAHELFEDVGPMLGLALPTSRWPVVDAELDGQGLLIYTDGLPEVPLAGSRERFGILRLFATIDALGLDPEAIYGRVVEAAGRPLRDDVAMLALSHGRLGE